MNKNYNGKNISNEKIFLYFGISVFTYSLCAALVIQFFVLDVLVHVYRYDINLANGLTVLDSFNFDLIAREMSTTIREEGWQAWELRPQGSSPAGIASIFYTLWTPKPYSLLPLNALVHALSGCFVFWILKNFFSWKSAILGATIFVLNPAAMEWVAQIHRDGLFILGNLMILTCLFQFSNSFESGKVKTMVWGLFYGVLGSIIAWISRPYWLEILLILILLWIILFFLVNQFKCVYKYEK